MATSAPPCSLHSPRFTTHDLVGLDRKLLYGAMRVCAANPQAGVRNGLSTIYPKLTQTDIEQVGDVFVNIAYENAPAGMGITGARMPAMSFLQSKGKAEGVPLAIRFAEDLGYESGWNRGSPQRPCGLCGIKQHGNPESRCRSLLRGLDRQRRQIRHSRSAGRARCHRRGHQPGGADTLQEHRLDHPG